MSKLERLRDAGIAHATHEFSVDEQALVESLSHEEIETLVQLKAKLGKELSKKLVEIGGGVHPNTFVL